MHKKLVCLLIATAISALAQSDRGRITGRVLDTSGAAVAGATVTVVGTATDFKRETHSDNMGRYLAEGLLSATYKVTAAAPGFADAIVSDLVLSVGQERAVDFRLQPASVKETITVASGALAEVETSSASLAANISTREVASLPLNGRMLSQLYLLVPGASSTGSGQFNEMRFAGRANEQNTIRYDGVQAGAIIGSSPADPSGGGAAQMRLAQSLENVQEFRVESSTYSAEYGRGAGGQITVITKSGSNDLHGGLFEYVRNDALDARNYFDRASKQAPLRLNQFGGSLGGAIKKDKLFYFVSQENLAQRVYVSFLQNTLSAYARSQAVPAMVPVLAAYPIGNAGATSSPYFDLVSGTLSSYVNDHFGSARFDYHINDRSGLYLRFNRQQGDSFVPSDISGSGSQVAQTAQNAVVDFTRVFGAATVNDAKVGLNLYKARSITQGVNLPGLNLSDVQLSIGGAAQSGATGIVTPSGAGSTPVTHAQPYTNYEWSFIDNVSWTHGAHSFKAGVEYNPRGMYLDQIGGATYLFTNVQSFLAGTPSQVTLTNDVSSPSVFHSGAKGVRHGIQYFAGAFIQDEWKLRPNLTMNAGVRYDYFSPLSEKNNLTVCMNTDTGKIDTSGYPGLTTSKVNFAPRLAFTWAPERLHNSTVFRIGAGYYYGAGQGEDQTQQILNDLVSIQLTSGISFPVDRDALIAKFSPYSPTAGYTPRAYATGYNLPEKVLSYSASIQQTLPDHSVLTVGYVGSQGRNMFQRTITNKIASIAMNPTSGAAIINREFGDQFGEVDVKTSFGTNHYDSLQIGWNRRFAKGLTSSLQYSWSHNIGTSAGSNEATTSENNYSFGQERGDNSFDLRHVLTAAALYELPFGRGRKYSFGNSRAADLALGGWQLGGNMNFHTGTPINVLMQRNNVLYLNPSTGQYSTSPVVSGGQPVTIPVLNLPGGGQSRGTQRPDLVQGVDPYVSTGGGFWLNPAAFSVPMPGTYGNLARNALRGPQFTQFDMTMSKRFTLTERFGLEMRGEFYNILNHPNFSNPSANLGAGGQPGTAFTKANATSSFGLLGSTVGKYVNNGTNRQIQLSMRLSF